VLSGLWAGLKPRARAVYVALLSRADARTRATLVGADLVARLSGYSRASVLLAYRELRGHGLISRRRIVAGPYKPFRTVLLNPEHWRVSDEGGSTAPPVPPAAAVAR
jgi:hypothetical protein